MAAQGEALHATQTTAVDAPFSACCLACWLALAGMCAWGTMQLAAQMKAHGSLATLNISVEPRFSCTQSAHAQSSPQGPGVALAHNHPVPLELLDVSCFLDAQRALYIRSHVGCSFFVQIGLSAQLQRWFTPTTEPIYHESNISEGLRVRNA